MQNISSYGISFVSGNEDVSFDWKYKQVVFLLKWTICMLITQFHYEMMFSCNNRWIGTSIWFVHEPKNNSNATFIIQFFRTSKVKLKVKVKSIINANIVWNSCFVHWLFKTYSNLRSWTLVNFSLLFLAFNSWILHNL